MSIYNYTNVSRLFEGYESLLLGDVLLMSRTKKEALEFNEDYYFDGICKKGHLAIRVTKNGRCIKCTEEEYKNWLDNGGKEKRSEYARESRRVNLNVKVAKIARNQVYRIVSQAKIKKVGKTFDVLGYSVDDFIRHMEGLFSEEMNWGNYGDVWEIDHVKPIMSFDIKSMKDVSEVNALSNLMPILKQDHKLKTIQDIIENRKKNLVDTQTIMV